MATQLVTVYQNTPIPALAAEWVARQVRADKGFETFLQYRTQFKDRDPVFPNFDTDFNFRPQVTRRHEYMLQAYQKWHDRLRNNELMGLTSYVTKYTVLNPPLRQGYGLDPYVAHEALYAEHALLRASAPPNFTVLRGSEWGSMADVPCNIRLMLEGKTRRFRDPGFVSTTVSQWTAYHQAGVMSKTSPGSRLATSARHVGHAYLLRPSGSMLRADRTALPFRGAMILIAHD